MKKEHKLFIAGGLVALLGGGFYAVTQKKQADRTAHSAGAAQDVPKIEVAKDKADKVTKIVVTHKEHGEVVLEKKGDAWRVTKPLDVLASASNVDQLLKSLDKLKLETVIAAAPDDKTFEKYELDGKSATHAQIFAGDEKLLDAFFGKSGSRGQLARVADKNVVYTVKGYSSYLFARELKNWRDTDVLKFEDGNVISAEVENDKGKFSFTKSDDKWSGAFYPRQKDGKLEEKSEKWANFDEAKVKDMLRAYKALKATDFAKEGADTGVAEPAKTGGIVRLKLKDDAGSFTLNVGRAQEGTNRYLVKEGGDGTVYVVSSWAAEWATGDLAKYSKPDEKKGDKDKKDAAGDAGDAEMPELPGMPDLHGDQ